MLLLFHLKFYCSLHLKLFLKLEGYTSIKYFLFCPYPHFLCHCNSVFYALKSFNRTKFIIRPLNIFVLSNRYVCWVFCIETLLLLFLSVIWTITNRWLNRYIQYSVVALRHLMWRFPTPCLWVKAPLLAASFFYNIYII